MSGEWKAWLTRRGVTLRPCSRKWLTTEFTASAAPATTTAFGPLTAAMSTSPVSSGNTSSSEARTATIAPPSGSACIRRPRAATSLHASASDHTPATCAAAISPIECPASTSGGRMPVIPPNPENVVTWPKK